MDTLKVEALRQLLATATDGMGVYLGRKDGPIVSVDDAIVSTDPDGKPCIILFEKE